MLPSAEKEKTCSCDHFLTSGTYFHYELAAGELHHRENLVFPQKKPKKVYFLLEPRFFGTPELFPVSQCQSVGVVCFVGGRSLTTLCAVVGSGSHRCDPVVSFFKNERGRLPSP